ncbi:MAG: TIR domain-containing protein, partial [bacterium]
VDQHLQNSANLIVICSPNARASDFVNDEIRRFLKHNAPENIISIHLAGIPNNEIKPGQENVMAFPGALCEAMQMPLAINYTGFNDKNRKLNKGDFEGAWYKILANLYKLPQEEIEQRDRKRQRRQRRIRNAITAAVMVALSVLAGVAWMQKLEVDSQRMQTEMRLARNYWENGRQALAEGNSSLALHYMAEAVQHVPKEAAFARIVRQDMPEHLYALRLGSGMQHENYVRSKRILSWSYDGSVRLWDVPGDLDCPKEIYPLQVQTLTGTSFDLNTRQVNVLTIDEWQHIRGQYLEAAKAHAAECEYPRQNVYLRYVQKG